ncbi:hypothetical protein K438DRAFT_1786451 [Mycena galopus ATCC 62051]|nr:hypothetical protein K438DRAFT_1786451 [Mycena galopus ATCC 62051]
MKARPTNPPNHVGIKGSILKPSGLHADKTCFKCGIHGHIGSDPLCPKFSELPVPRERPRVGAQRVPESYLVEDDELELDTDPGDGQHREDWGGSQYNSEGDDYDPRQTADLSDLIEANEDEEPRLGTIRYQYYAVWAELTDVPTSDTAAGMMRSLPANLRPSSGHDHTRGIRQLSASEELRITAELRAMHQYPEYPPIQFDSVAMEFEARHRGDGPWSRSATDEWECLLLLQLAEHIHNVVRNTILDPLALTREYSARELAIMNTADLDHLMTQFLDRAQLLKTLRNNMTDLNRQARKGRGRAIASAKAPRGSRSSARLVIEAASDMMEALVHATVDFIRMASRAEYRRERYLVRLRYDHSVRPDLLARLEGPVLDPNAPPVIYISDFESDEDGDETGEDSKGEPVPASPSPPPLYTRDPDNIGTEASTDDGLWETLSSPGSELFEDPVQGPFTADGQPPARLGAMRALESDVRPYYGLLCLDTNSPSIIIAESEFAALGQSSLALQIQLANLQPRENRLACEHDSALEELEIKTDAARESFHQMRLALHTAQDICTGLQGESSRSTTPASSSSTDDVARELWPARTSEEEEELITILPQTRQKPDPRPDDECILRSVVMLFGGQAEQHLTFVDHNGNLYVRIQDLPANHYLSAEFHREHRAAMALAISERNTKLGLTHPTIESVTSWAETGTSIRDRRGYRDSALRLLPGEAFHERLASLDPDQDNEDADPGFRVQMLAQHVEHLSNINRKTIYETAQPSRLRKDIACLSAQVEINGTLAYMLFDSGSNIDSLTPEFTRATNCKSIMLDEQVTLQLGCVGSRFKINYDRYDGVIGTPFMNKHGIIFDFGAREIRFPNNQVIKALSTLEEASLLASRNTDSTRRVKPRILRTGASTKPAMWEPKDTHRSETSLDDRTEPPRRPRRPATMIETCTEGINSLLPTLPTNCPYVIMTELDFNSTYDSHEHHLDPVDQEHTPSETSEPVVQNYAATFALREDEPAIHFYLPHIPSLERYDRSHNYVGMPDLKPLDSITSHSSSHPMSLAGDYDPFRINDIALDGAIDRIRLPCGTQPDTPPPGEMV